MQSIAEVWITLLGKLTWPAVTIIMALSVVVVVLYRLQVQDNRVDFRDLLVPETRRPTMSLQKFCTLSCLGVTSWGYISLTVSNHLTETYFIAYMLIWCGNEALQRWIILKFGGKFLGEPGPDPQPDPPAAEPDPPVTPKKKRG